MPRATTCKPSDTSVTAAFYAIQCETPGYFYLGATKDLSHRIKQHLGPKAPKITKKHGVKDVIYIRFFPTMYEATIFECFKARQLRLRGFKNTYGGGYTFDQEAKDSRLDEPSFT